MKTLSLETERFLVAVALVLVTATGLAAQTVKVVDIVPVTSSGEVNHDSEPNLTVNPINPLLMVATAFTPDPLLTSGVAPVFLSQDGGKTWTLSSILTIPASDLCVGNATCDITPRFAQISGESYISWLTVDTSYNFNMYVSRLNPFPLPPPSPTNLQDITNTYPLFVDQPFTQAWTALTGPNSGHDRVYIGENNLQGGTGGKTAGLDQSLTAETSPPAGFDGLTGIEGGTTCSQDGPPVRPVVHPAGTIYVAFYRWTSCSGSTYTSDVVVVRDDNWGSGGTPYQSLMDGGVAGKRVVTGISIPSCNSLVGNQRTCGSLSIAVDPNDNSKVWLVYAGGTSATNYTLHVRNSSDGGATWSSDLKTVTAAINPALAITTESQVGFLYQKLVNPGTCTGGSPCWETHLEATTDGSSWADTVLANTPDTLTTVTHNPLGDYEYLAAVGKDFYGIFSANNLPYQANFPSGVSYQRYGDLTVAHQLYADVGHTTTVANSIDPYFFSVTQVPPSGDFYVRDWTDSPTSHDQGEEPSTNPVWWTTSDVWNRTTDTAGAFTNDQPAQQTAQDQTSGHNWAFARVSRKAAAASGAPDVTVNISFLFADYGLGVPYEWIAGTQSASSTTLTFSASATEQAMPDGTGVQWDIPATRSTHVCLAVEISAPGDNYAPELLGRAPGWPTDLLITTDNNKAQINMDLPKMGQSNGQLSFLGIVHNAANFRRNLRVTYTVAPRVLRKLQHGEIALIWPGGRRVRVPLRDHGTIVFPNMEPGENRWLGVSYRAPGAKAGDSLPITFREIVGGSAVNGFTIAPRVSRLDEVLTYNLQQHRAAFARLAAAFHVNGAGEQSEAAGKILRSGPVSGSVYIRFLSSNMNGISRMVSELIARDTSGDEFGLQPALAELRSRIPAGDPQAVAAAHLAFLNNLDAFQNMLQKSGGDPADILQMVRWQRDLYSSLPRLHSLKSAAFVLKESDEFVRDYGKPAKGGESYPAFLRELLPSFRDAAEALEKAGIRLEPAVEQIQDHLGDVRSLEKAHRQFLLKASQAQP